MECNKEEAIRAMELAEKKMQDHDFAGALKFAEKAQRLFPELDNVSRLLTVCEVHCSSQVKILGNEMDWYSILKIEQTVDEAAIKKQYRKLALLLHPDKNKFAGAEAAFKMICEANRFLLDQAKRTAYDRKYALARKAVRKPSKPQTNGNPYVWNGTNVQNFARPQNTAYFTNQQANEQIITFWTRCPFCNVRYQYYRSLVNMEVPCQTCYKRFVAHDIGIQTPPGSFRGPLPNQHEVPNQGSQQMPSEVNKGNSSRKRASSTSKGPPPKSEERKEKREKVDLAKKQGVEMPKAGTVKSEKPESSKNVDKKRQRRQIIESSDSEDAEAEDGIEENGLGSAKLNGQHHRRSSRQKHNVSYRDQLSDDDGFTSRQKRSRVGKSSSVREEETKGKEEKMSGAREENSTADNSPELKSNEASDSHNFVYPDPEFHDFDKDKAEICFAADQIWAIYDPEGLPRFYAIIKRVSAPGSKLKITWLEADPKEQDEVDWCDVELPVACGKYELGGTQVIDRSICSHQMHGIKGKFRNRVFYLVYPRKGETWAVFQNWDIKWSSDPEKHKPFKFDYVEVMSDFDKDKGVSVSYLGRIKGFVSLFQRSAHHGAMLLQIPPTKMYSFSHRIPSFRMTGKEREGVPEGSYEFDPASLPQSYFEGNNHDGTKMDTESIKAETKGLHPGSQKSEAKNASGFEEISVSEKHDRKNSTKEIPLPRKSPRKLSSNSHNGENQRTTMDSEKPDENQTNLSPSKRSATMHQTDVKLKTPKKQESKPAAEASKPRRSPRDVSKNINKAKGNQPTIEELFSKQAQWRKDANSGSSGHIKLNDSSSTDAAETPSGKKENPSKSSMKSPAKLALPESFDFTQLKSTENFKVNQIWAMRTNGETFPKTYVQVKNIKSTPRFQVCVSLLDPILSSKDATEPVCCGIFTVKSGKPMAFPLSAFSHRVSAKLVGKNRYEIYPRKGEIWVLYKSRNADSACPNPSKGEWDIVEVLEDHEQSTEVAVLLSFAESKSFFKAPRIQRSKAGVVLIPRAEIARFSHQIPAFQHPGSTGIAACWELDIQQTP